MVPKGALQWAPASSLGATCTSLKHRKSAPMRFAQGPSQCAAGAAQPLGAPPAAARENNTSPCFHCCCCRCCCCCQGRVHCRLQHAHSVGADESWPLLPASVAVRAWAVCCGRIRVRLRAVRYSAVCCCVSSRPLADACLGVSATALGGAVAAAVSAAADGGSVADETGCAFSSDSGDAAAAFADCAAAAVAVFALSAEPLGASEVQQCRTQRQ